MTAEHITHIKRTWKLFREINPAVVGDTFYSKLFADQPSLRRMFPANMEDQYKKLIDMLNKLVARLERPEELDRDLSGMAQRHADYGVKPEHYAATGTALLWTLRKGLGADWNEAAETAWTLCYHKIATTMINASSITITR